MDREAVSPDGGAPVRVVQRGRGLFTAFTPELFGYRDLLLSLIRRDVALRYRQTLLGPVWVLLQPLLAAGVFTFFFTAVAEVPLPRGVPYYVFALVGLAIWTGFSQAFNRSTASLLADRDVVVKIYFPRYLLPLAAALSAVVDCVAVLVVTGIVAVATRVDLAPGVLVVVPVLGVTIALALAVGSVLACLLVRYRDVGLALPVITQALLFLTPILYPLSAVPDGLRPEVEANPLTYVFELLRWGAFGSPMPPVSLAASAGITVLVVCIASAVAFSQLERDMADVI